MNDQAGMEAAHLRVAELVQGLHSRPDADSETVVAELAEHAAVEIPGAQYAGITLARTARRSRLRRRPITGRCCSTSSSSGIRRAPA